MEAAAAKLMARLLEWTGFGMAAASGAAVRYLYVQLSRDAPFSGKRLVLHMLMAFWVGVIIGESLAPDYKFTFGVVALTGYFTQHILAFAEDTAAPLVVDAARTLLVERLRRLFGLQKKEDE